MTSSLPLLGVALAALFLAASSSRRGPSKAPRPPEGGGLEGVYDLATAIEDFIPGIATFAMAAANTESGGHNLIARGIKSSILPSGVHVNLDDNEAEAACNLYHGALSRGFYQENPYSAAYFCFGSGGWFGFLPATGLAAGGTNGPFAEASPLLVFDPVASMVMFADFVKRVMSGDSFQSLPEGEKNWLAVRRGMASANLIDDYNEENSRSRGVRERLEESLAEIGADPDFAFSRPQLVNYPGAAALLDYLQSN